MKTIRFNPAQVNAILKGDKTQHRILPKFQPDEVRYCTYGAKEGLTDAKHATLRMDYPPERFRPCGATWVGDSDQSPFEWKYGKVGDFIRVKEDCQIYGHYTKCGKKPCGKQNYIFRAHDSKQVRYFGEWHAEITNRTDLGWHYRKAIAMPEWAVRIKLELTRHRIERLHDITESDAIADNVRYGDGCPIYLKDIVRMAKRLGTEINNKALYAAVWDKVNQFNGHQWSKNDWVNVIEFKVVEVKT